LEGIADLHRFLTVDQMNAIREEIDANLMGAGDAFYAVWSSLAQIQIPEPKAERPET
jgi:hypothetical protein